MDYNILIGGEAGQGIVTVSGILEKSLQRHGFEVFSNKDYMSRVRGGHNFTKIRFSNTNISSHRDSINTIIALDIHTINYHETSLEKDGTIIADETYSFSGKNILSLPIIEMAKESGSIKSFGIVALGVLVKLYSLDDSIFKSVIKETFNEKLYDINILAFIKGLDSTSNKYTTTTPKTQTKIMLNGNQAVALGAITAGCKFFSAYPMTPSTSIMNYLASKMSDSEIVVEQAEDEIAAINMAIGASYAGVRSMTATSGGGFSLMVEALGLAGITETPLVIAEIQRPGPATGFPTRTEQSDLRFVISASQGEFPRMVIALKNPYDAFYQTIRAFDLADKYRIPIILLGDQYLADYENTIPTYNLENIEIDRHFNIENIPADKEFKTYKINNTSISPRIIPGMFKDKVTRLDSDTHDEYGNITESAELGIKMVDKRNHKLTLLMDELEEPVLYGSKKPDILFVAWGSLDGIVKETINKLNNKSNLKYSALVFGDVYPLPQKKLLQISKNVQQIINIEMNSSGQLAGLIREYTGIKVDKSILKYDGRQISSDEIIDRMEDING